MHADADNTHLPAVTTLRWRSILRFLPIALLIDAAAAYFGWLVWVGCF